MTFSITAVDTETGHVGVAVTTSSIAVGSRCPWVRAGVGAVATQNITDPILGRAILDCIESGDDAEKAILRVIGGESYVEYRQLTAVDLNGVVGHYTGKNILGTNSVVVGSCCVAAGNLLANEEVPQAMVDSFENRDKTRHFAESLLNSLQAGLDAGGEEGEVRSAAVLVANQVAWADVNLRVDWADNPVTRLRSIWQEYEPQRADYVTRALSPGDAPSYGVPGDM